MSKRSPEQVFTPKTIVSREMFERRNEEDLDGNPGLQDILRDALREQGGQVVIFGDTGVGKSSLMRYAAEDELMKTVVVECISSKSYVDLLEDALRKLVEVKEIRRTSTRSASAQAEAGATLKMLVTIKGTLTGSRGKSSEYEVVEKPLIDALVAAMQASDVRILVLDNFQNVKDDETRLLVAQTMELLSDRASATGDIKCVVIGIADDAPSLIAGSGSFRRRITEVGVPRMPDEEIREILTRGFRLLGVRADSSVLNDLVFYSDGFPFFAHLLGLQLSRWARTQPDAVLVDADIDRGLKRAIKAVDRSYAEKVDRAVERGGDIQPRKTILRILANSDRRTWKSADVIAAWEGEIGPREAYQFLHVALAALMDEKHGAVLKRTGSRNRYTYQFADPHMRPYLRLTDFGEKIEGSRSGGGE
ncbi:ATP-binding protein [Isoptericola sp. 4D.3]|uniref:ATP-binding protein n=1 Tax=Isoptericola peretonis TaxID=2918523 RepID=A0ABT0J1F2_9MICO|nr:ATP-binding protein [Isoptericola sp. 4D.3]